MKKDETGNVVIDFNDFLAAIWHYRLILVVFVLIGSLLGGLYTAFIKRDEYTTSGIIYVSSRGASENTSELEIDKGDIDAARSLSTTYIETLKIRPFLNSVSIHTGEKYSWSDIERMMTISAINETELISVKITAESADSAYMLIKSIMKLAPDTLSRVTSGGKIEVLDDGVRPARPDDKGMVNNIFLGGFIAAAIALAIIFALTYFDKKIRKKEDIEGRYKFSILGIIEN